MTNIHITVYGAEVKCASCIHLPSALETKEWLDAAIQRKFPQDEYEVTYCDIYSPTTEEEKSFSEKILEDEYFYPLVVINSEVVAEGNPRLPVIFRKIEETAKK
ncbi:disulfide oxidoreductase [Salipaludibacillus keqinensis]|jgi:disulfide oxidoreductase YuzD|uniref:Disulfide oxidoreductase n=1 Tax=Salipaludibacillus keqinensis TaxID=2045207 RepID=A0A323TJS4_9BACI|nr:YuzD family protein [Salipaludibacillus keqinensis]PYZ92923.1 disulfide oxidoreductase [Salipaludibacillus keqinensis]